MKFAAPGDAFDGDDFASRHQAERHEATVNGAVTRLPERVAVNDHDRTRAAVAFGAALFCARQADPAQKFQQRRVGRTVRNPDLTAIQDELQGTGHKTIDYRIMQKYSPDSKNFSTEGC
jgi:hypothetical protein